MLVCDIFSGCTNRAQVPKACIATFNVPGRLGGNTVRSSQRFGPTDGLDFVKPVGTHHDEPFKPQVWSWLKEKEKDLANVRMATTLVCRP